MSKKKPQLIVWHMAEADGSCSLKYHGQQGFCRLKKWQEGTLEGIHRGEFPYVFSPTRAECLLFRFPNTNPVLIQSKVEDFRRGKILTECNIVEAKRFMDLSRYNVSDVLKSLVFRILYFELSKYDDVPKIVFDFLRTQDERLLEYIYEHLRMIMGEHYPDTYMSLPDDPFFTSFFEKTPPRFFHKFPASVAGCCRNFPSFKESGLRKQGLLNKFLEIVKDQCSFHHFSLFLVDKVSHSYIRSKENSPVTSMFRKWAEEMLLAVTEGKKFDEWTNNPETYQTVKFPEKQAKFNPMHVGPHLSADDINSLLYK